MIVLPTQKLIIITPPKTASTTLHKVLCTEERGGIWVNGLSIGGRTVDHHVVGQAPGYRLLMTVRQPLDRLGSLYLHQARYDAGLGRATEAFWCFANRVGRGEHPDPMYQWNQVKYLEGLKRREDGLIVEPAPPALLHVETLQSDLVAAGLDVGELPRANAMPFRQEWQFYFGEGPARDSLLAVLEEWAKPDFERFGYEWAASPANGQ